MWVMLLRTEEGVHVCSCDSCGAEIRRKTLFGNRSGHYCDAKCTMQAVRDGKLERKVTLIDIDVARQDPRRVKTCVWCSVEYVDRTKRNVGRTCSKKCSSESMVAKRKANGSYTPTEEQNAARSKTMKEGIASGRILWWKSLTPEAMKKGQDANRGPNPNHWTKSPEARERISQRRLGWKPSDETRVRMSRSAQNRVRTKRDTLHSSACGGHREDLGQYFRSRWEANFARILNYQGKVWEYEPTTFQLDPTTSYTPDFLCEGVYYELKGRWYEGHAEKVAKFRELHPELTLVLIQEAEYRELSRQYKMVVIGWEGK